MVFRQVWDGKPVRSKPGLRCDDWFWTLLVKHCKKLLLYNDFCGYYGYYGCYGCYGYFEIIFVLILIIWNLYKIFLISWTAIFDIVKSTLQNGWMDGFKS
jgi:hypothetical protein